MRWTVAKKVAEAIMGQWKGEHSFSILQFHRPAHTYVEGHEDETFTMQHFLAYAKIVMEVTGQEEKQKSRNFLVTEQNNKL